MLRCSVSMRWMTMVSSRRTRWMLFIAMVALFSSQRRDGVAQIGHEIADHFRDGAPIARRRRVFEVALQRFEAVCNHRHVETDPLGAIWPSVSMCLNVLFSIRWFFPKIKTARAWGSPGPFPPPAALAAFYERR